MARFCAHLIVLAGLLAASQAMADTIRIAVVAPTSGPLAILGQQVMAGASFDADARGIEIVPLAESCETEAGADLGTALASADVVAAIGFLCTESLTVALPVLAVRQIPAITLSVRSSILMEDVLKNKWPLLQLAPAAKAEADKAIQVVSQRWAGETVALVDDGTLHGRELVDAVRAAMEETGFRPAFVDTYRPGQDQQLALVRRLKKAGADHIVVGGDRSDIAIIARDAAAEKTSLTILGGEALLAADQSVPLPDGILAIGMPEDAQSGTGNAVVEKMAQSGIVAEGYVLPAYAAVDLVRAAAAASATDSPSLMASLLRGPFETAMGPIQFTERQALVQNPYRLLEWRAGRFREADATQ